MAAATALLAVLPLTAASGATHNVLTIGRAGGKNVKVGAILKARLQGHTRATFFTPGTRTGVQCRRATVTDKVRKNPRTPGTAVESLTGQTFGRCTTNIAGATAVRSVRVTQLPYLTTIRSSASHSVTVFRARTKITLKTVLGTVTCTFATARIRAHASNVGQRIIFTKQVFRLSAGSSACPARGSFSATFGPVADFSVRGHPHVFVN
jgi:hypothetical protein